MKHFFCLLLTALLLAGCAKVKHAFTPNEVSRRTPGGYFKVGEPYKIDDKWYTPREEPDYDEKGIASWYGAEFHNKLTANGDIYDMRALTAAHRTLPMPSMVRVTNLENGRTLILMVNDRGPYAKGRIIDVSERAAEILGFKHKGISKVRVQYLQGQSERLRAQLEKNSDKLPKYKTVSMIRQDKLDHKIKKPESFLDRLRFLVGKPRVYQPGKGPNLATLQKHKQEMQSQYYPPQELHSYRDSETNSMHRSNSESRMVEDDITELANASPAAGPQPLLTQETPTTPAATQQTPPSSPPATPANNAATKAIAPIAGDKSLDLENASYQEKIQELMKRTTEEKKQTQIKKQAKEEATKNLSPAELAAKSIGKEGYDEQYIDSSKSKEERFRQGRTPSSFSSNTPTSHASISSTPMNPKRDSMYGSGIPAHFIQVGAYGVRNNAKRIADELSILGNVASEEVSIGGQNLYRVKLGPIYDKHIANTLLQKIITMGHVDALVLTMEH